MNEQEPQSVDDPLHGDEPWQVIVRALADGVVIRGPHGELRGANSAACELLGLPDDITGVTTAATEIRAVREDGSPLSVDHLPAAVTARTGEPIVGFVLGVDRPDGSRVWIDVNTHPMHDSRGRVQGAVGVFRDLTARRDAEQSAQRLSAIVESTADAVFATDPEGLVLTWNRGAEHLFGYDAADIVGRHASLLEPHDHSGEVVTLTAAARAGKTIQSFETTRRRKDGSEVDVSITISPIRAGDGTVDAVSAIIRDVSAQRTMRLELEHQALHDSVTGLPNRALLSDRLRTALARSERTGDPVAVLFIDLDDFKTINDGAGHGTGDAVLVEVGRRLVDAVRRGDTVARFGGDEFVVICERADAAAGSYVAEHILGALREAVDIDGRTFHLSASIGIAVSPPHDLDELLRHADTAMYDAKSRGRGRAVVFDPALAGRARENLELATDLRAALETDGLELHYQPLVELETGRFVGLEALCRWKHAKHGWIPPDRFVPLAEATGLIASLDRWVLTQAAADARHLLDTGILARDGRVAVNISAQNLADFDLEAAVRRAAADACIPYTALALEVTETGVMADPCRAANTLAAIRELGVDVKIDDFGTGYSSLTYLRRLPVDEIKIDRVFVRDIATDPDALAIVVSIVDLARSVHLATTAEGIETTEQLDILRRIGCSAGQGFLWSRAVPLDGLADLARLAPAGHFSRSQPGPITAISTSPEVTAEHGLTRLMRLHHAGASLTTIAAALNSEGFKTPAEQRWHTASVARAIAEYVVPLGIRSQRVGAR